MFSRRDFLGYAGLAAASAVTGGGFVQTAKSAGQKKPNILIIMADDCTHNDLPVYGGQNAATPNIDRFADEGLVFNRAYLASAMCQPCRAELYTGLYPMSNGCAWNHSASRPAVTSMPHHSGEGFPVREHWRLRQELRSQPDPAARRAAYPPVHDGAKGPAVLPCCRAGRAARAVGDGRCVKIRAEETEAAGKPCRYAAHSRGFLAISCRDHLYGRAGRRDTRCS